MEETAEGGREVNLNGKTFGRLTVIAKDLKRGSRYWMCACSCGNRTSVRDDHLSLGDVVSCGCFLTEVLRKRGTHHDTQDGRVSTEYRCWSTMIQRCTNPQRKDYPRYGGRGISVCERWLFSFEHFLEDMGRKPLRSLTIERIENKGDYRPGNCRWATTAEQNRNTRTNLRITIDAETMCLAAWAERSGVKAPTIWRRLRSGWDPKRAIFSPALLGRWHKKEAK